MPQRDMRENFADNLNKYMEAHGVSKSELAMRLDIAKSTVTSWCSGEKIPRFDKMERIAAAVGCTTADLMSLEGSRDELTCRLSARPDCRELLELALNSTPQEVRRLILVAQALKEEKNV